MRNETRKNKPARIGGVSGSPHGGSEKPTAKETPVGTKSQQYTPCQQERMLKGLRILAKVIVRAHLRRQAEQANTQ